MAQMLGLAGLLVPEELGGAGAGHVEVGIVQEELGRGLAPTPFFATAVLGVDALLLSEDITAQQRYLPAVADGQLRLAVAVGEGSATWVDEAVATSATRDGEQWLLTGTKDFVIDGATADVVLVFAATPEGQSLFAVPAAARGLTRTPLTTMDGTRKQARLTFDRSPASLVGQVGAGGEIAAALLDRALVALAAEQVGGTARVLEMAADYARTRVQFGRQIGSFQAIKHRCADMLIDLERARAAAHHGLWSIEESPGELPAAARLAKVFCSDAYFDAAASNIQVHGGIGFTWEHSAHLYYRRAKSSQLMFGTPGRHREELLSVLGI
jgi:acyl-CoA dehydrogenase